MSSPSSLFVSDGYSGGIGRTKEDGVARQAPTEHSKDQLSPLRPSSSSPGWGRRSRRSSSADEFRPSPTPSLGDRRSISRSPCSPAGSQSPLPQNFHSDGRPTVKFTVEGDPVIDTGGSRRTSSASVGGRRRELEGGSATVTRAKQIFMAQQPSPLPLPPTPPPYQIPLGSTPPLSAPPDGRSLEAEGGDDDEDDEEDYSASVSAILQQRRRASTRRSRRHRGRRASSPFSPLSPDGASIAARHGRRRSSVYTTSSADTGYSVAVVDDVRGLGGALDGVDPEAVAEGVAETASPTAIAAATQQKIFENLRLHKEVRESVRLQPWPMRRKVRLVQKAKAYVRRHEGELQERLAHGKSTRDLLARANLLIVKHWQHLRRELVNAAAFLIPWEQRIKEIESHFGSVVASYFTFLRWLFWVNLVIATLLVAFVMIPEFLVGREQGGSDDRKEMLPEEKAKATKLLTLWDFEGALKYSPMFYGFYSDREQTNGGYRIPFAYFLTGLAVYVYSFVATLRKMAENSRMSKLSEKDDECVFSWKLFTGWDYMIGNAETAHNRVASIILGFKEVLLEEREKQKDTRNWKVIALRVLVNALVLLLLASSAYAVVLVVKRSAEATSKDSWWRQNEITVVLSLISVAFPILFELIGFLESYHPRKQLRIQLARIMVLNLLNLYTLIFALFGKISHMTKELQHIKQIMDPTVLPYLERPSGLPTIPSDMTSLTSDSSSNLTYQSVEMSTALTTSSSFAEFAFANTSLSFDMSPRCFKELVDCIIETTTFQNSSELSTEKNMISLLVNVTTALIPIILKVFFHYNISQTTIMGGVTPPQPLFPSTTDLSLEWSSESDTWTNEIKKITTAMPKLPESSEESYTDDMKHIWTISNSVTSTSEAPNLTSTGTKFRDEEKQPNTVTTDSILINETEAYNTLDTSNVSSIDLNTDMISNRKVDATTDSSTTDPEEPDFSSSDSPTTIESSPKYLDFHDKAEADPTPYFPTNETESADNESTAETMSDNVTGITFTSQETVDTTTTINSVIDSKTDQETQSLDSFTTEASSQEETTLYISDSTFSITVENDTFIPDGNKDEYNPEDWTSFQENITLYPIEENSTQTTDATVDPGEQYRVRSMNDSLFDGVYMEVNKLAEIMTANYNHKSNSLSTDVTDLPHTSTESIMDSDFLTLTPYDPDVPVPLLKLNNPESSSKRKSSFKSPGDAASILKELEDRGIGIVDDDKKLSGPKTVSSEVPAGQVDLKSLQNHARTLLVGHISTILLTVAILASKEDDSRDITEKLFKKDESRILELIYAWKESLRGGEITNETKVDKVEHCFTGLCNGRKIDSFTSTTKVSNQNCSVSPCVYEKSQSNYSLETINTSTLSSTDPKECMMISKTNSSCKFVNDSRLEIRKKLRRLCWETMFGQELVKLTVMDLVLTIASTFLVDFIRALFVRIMNHCWCWDLEKQFPQYGDFKIAENILHLVYNQGMVWMGMFFSPGLPALNLAKLTIVLYVRSWIVLTCNVPHDVVFRASRSNNFYFALLLTMLFLCALPVGYALVWVEPSWHCGPFAGKERISSLFTSSVRSALPDQLQPVLDYVASPALIIPLLVLLVLVVAYLVSLAAALREANDDLRIQLRRERTEERRKMFRMANGRGGRRGRRSRAGRASDDVSGLGVGLEDFTEGDAVESATVAKTVAEEGNDSPAEAAPVIKGWRGLIGRITNIGGSPGKPTKKDSPDQLSMVVSTLRESKDNEVNAKNIDIPQQNNKDPPQQSIEPAQENISAGEVVVPHQTSSALPIEGIPTKQTASKTEEEAQPQMSSSPPHGDRDSPSSACWSGDIPLIRIVRTADDGRGRRAPQQAQPQQPSSSYVNIAMDTEPETSHPEPTEKSDS